MWPARTGTKGRASCKVVPGLVRPTSVPVVGVILLLVGVVPSASAQHFGETIESAIGPIVETSERVELRAARLAIEDDLVRRFRAVGSQAGVYVASPERFARLCDRHTRPQGAPYPLPHKTWGDCKESASELGFNYLVLIELWAREEAPADPAAGAPIEFNYQVYNTKDGSIEDRNRFLGNTLDLSGALSALMRRVGPVVGFATDQAFESASDSVPTKSKEAFSAYWLGRAYLEMGKYPEALTSLQKAAQLDPEYRAVTIAMADVKLEQAKAANLAGDWAGGLTSCEAAIEELRKIGALGKLAEALQLKGELLQKSGRQKESWVARKEAALALMQWGQIEDGYDIAVKLADDMKAAGADKTDADVCWLLGHAHLLLEGLYRDLNAEGHPDYLFDFQRAEQFLTDALIINPKHLPSLVDRGRLYRIYGSRYDPSVDDVQKQWRRTWLEWAEKDISQAFAQAATDPIVWIEYGDIYVAKSDYGSKPSANETKLANEALGTAIQKYTRAIDLLHDQDKAMDAVTGNTFLKLAACFRRIGEVDRALDAARNAQTILGDQADAPWIEMIMIYCAGGDFDKGRDTLKQALAILQDPSREIRKMEEYITKAEADYSESGQAWTPHRWPERQQWPPQS